MSWISGRRTPDPEPTLRITPLADERGFRLAGDLDIFAVDAVRETLEPELHGALVLDLAAVPFMDDSGLGLLLRIHKRLAGSGGSLVLRNPSERIARTFEVTGLSKVLNLAVDRDATQS